MLIASNEVTSLLERFSAEFVQVARIVADSKTATEAHRANMGSRALRLAVAEHVTGAKVKATEGIPKESKALLNVVKSVFSQARRAVKIAKSNNDTVIYAWLNDEPEAPSMWKYLRDNTPKPDKLEAAMKIVTQYFMIEEPEALERFVARIELDRENMSNAAQKLLDSLNH